MNRLHSHVSYAQYSISLQYIVGSSVGEVVKLFGCGARGPGFDSRSRHYDFRDLFLLPSHDMAERSLKRRKSSKQPTNNAIYCVV